MVLLGHQKKKKKAMPSLPTITPLTEVIITIIVKMIIISYESVNKMFVNLFVSLTAESCIFYQHKFKLSQKDFSASRLNQVGAMHG